MTTPYASKIRLSNALLLVCWLLCGAPGAAATLLSLEDPQEREETPYPHGEFEEECTMCHSNTAWAPARISDDFDHSDYGFALDGSHNRVMCRACHVSLDFAEAESACSSCHLDVHRGEFGVECAQCHTTRNWIDRADELRSHQTTRFPLTGAHRVTDCESCHALQPGGGQRFIGTPVKCEICHAQDFQTATNPDHVALGFDRNCTQCHRTVSWEGGRPGDNFDHTLTGFALRGAHAPLGCVDCHAGNRFSEASPLCASCHQQDFQTASQPDHVAGSFPMDCQQCHTDSAWSPATFDHALTAFPLTGTHSTLACEQCHDTGSFADAAPQCNSCHLNDYQQAPGHVASNFAQTCEDCHTTVTWTTGAIDHSFFPLTAGHSGVGCASCHTGGTYATIPSDCVSCHQTDYQMAAGHVSSGFPQTCESCHTVTTWTDADFDHSFYPLSGGHSGVQCAQCHTDGTFVTLPTDCVSCHQTDYQMAAGHVSSGFPQTCDDCHSVTTWTDADFDHSFYPLSGGHSGVQCTQCHTSGTFATLPTDCVSCHQTDYQMAAGHVSSGFPQTCDDCHSVTTWTDADFDHSFYPLNGGHSGVQCAQCHTSGTFATIPTDCVSCHQTDYQAAAGHVSSGFPQTCDDCHSVTTWTDADFDHSFYPLNGGHSGVQCAQCHTSGTFATIPTDCVSCHQTDYQAAAGHVSSGFPQTCDDCHSVTTWTDADFDHSFYPLSGGHSGVQCAQCHTTGTFGTIPTDCVSCHQTDYQAAAGHVSSGFPQTCDDCHSVTTWTDADFDHSFYPLSGGHSGVQCAQCHTTGTFGTIPSDCVSCHQSDYQAAAGHVSSGFPQTCDDCHSVTTWANADFDHSFFALSGGHAGIACVSCHTTGTFGTIPSDCVSCHQADYQLAPGHVSSGFPQTCEECHTVTTWANASFDHGLFPLTGGHNGLDCVACHTSGVYGGIPAECYSCHQSDYAQAPDHTNLQFPLECEECHTTSTWTNSTFVHPWPLRGPHRDLDCAECHISGTTQDFSCLGACHEHTPQRMADKHSGESGYSYSFPLCISCHANGQG